MSDYIFVGCDLHDRNMLLKIAADREAPHRRGFSNTPGGHKRMLAELKKRSAAAGDAKVFFAYEASAQGYVLYDTVSEAGMTCFVLAPTHMPRSAKHVRSKCDEKDAELALDLLRAHVLAGSKLHAVCVPDKQTRDERELVRARADVGHKLTRVKSQVQSLLKRHGLRRPAYVGGSWTNRHRKWLRNLVDHASPLGPWAKVVLDNYLSQVDWLEKDVARLDAQVAGLAKSPRYAAPVREAMREDGVGLVTAMVFLTELGDLRRFSNRRQVGSYLGLVPSRSQSGECQDGFGHITHQGPARVRKVLCQSVWSWIRVDPKAQALYERLQKKDPKKRKKIAVVAMMRRRAVRLYHRCLEAQGRAGSYARARPPAERAGD